MGHSMAQASGPAQAALPGERSSEGRCLAAGEVKRGERLCGRLWQLAMSWDITLLCDALSRSQLAAPDLLARAAAQHPAAC